MSDGFETGGTAGRGSAAQASANILVDSLDEHMAASGGIDRAALLPGMYLGWCVRLGLVTQAFKTEHDVAVLRLNYGEGSGVELLVSCGGRLHYNWLTAQGAAFTRDYYPGYAADWASVFGADIYGVEDSWSNYDLLAPVLTRALYAFNGHAAKTAAANDETKRPGRWTFWR